MSDTSGLRLVWGNTKVSARLGDTVSDIITKGSDTFRKLINSQ